MRFISARAQLASCVLTTIALAAAATHASAQDVNSGRNPAGQGEADIERLGEIIVTAEKRAESAQSVPIAISAFTGEELENAGVTDIESLKQVSPNLQFGKGPIDNFVSIRGVGAELINISSEPGVSIAQDGVPFSSPTMFDAAFMDVARIEVLRGPQGTIAGRNATGGTINIYSALPTSRFEGRVRAAVANFDYRMAEGMISGPLAGDVLLGRLAVRRERSDGWATNTLTGETFNNADNFKARATLLAKFSPDFTASLILEKFIDDSSPMIFGLGRARPDRPSYAEAIGSVDYDREARTFSANYPSNRRVEGEKGILRLSWDLGLTTNLTSITGYVANKNSGQFGGALVDTLAVFDYLETDVEQRSQEVTLTTDLSDRLDLILGGIYLNSKSHEPLLFGLPSAGLPVDTFDFTADQTLNSFAFYTQWRYRLSDEVRLTVGGRYTHDEKHYREVDFFAGFPLPTVDAKRAWEAFTPRFAIDYMPNPDLLFYASVSRGFKAGGINAFATSDGTFDEFEPEFIWNYEAGVKANLLDNRVQTSLTGFYMDYTNVQQNLRILNETTGVLLPNVINASSATIKGIEASIDAAATDQLMLRAAGTWLDATYDELETNDLIYPELGLRDLSGNRLTRAPEWQFTTSGIYTLPIGNSLQAIFRADYQWQSKVYFSFFNHPLNAQKAYGVLNLSASLGGVDGNWRLDAFVRNVTDAFYVTYAEANVSQGNPSLGGAVGQPRMYGLSAEFKF
ncbi:TonB-dependent receptor [Sphingosinicella sp.]|uniref:TonB-dependent receptor n=1 Tax=Sphingosinicella sp. TaxID=1917971 RepID=UPI0018131E20|nr:TonB-dependent receptor [Sphingosinicella sp.]MBA4759299.1 TonB-dependent receptor [Sphingosinicella sp.]